MDIIDKCSWHVNIVLQIAAPAERNVLDDNYRQKDAAWKARIKLLYEEIGLREHYATYEQQSYDCVIALINTIPVGGKMGDEDESILKCEVFKSFLDKVYKYQNLK